MAQFVQQPVLVQGQVPQQIPQNLPPHIIAYNQQGTNLTPAVVPHNPNFKAQVGEFIYEFVEAMAGEERAPKITGMLIDLPMQDIRAFLVDYGRLQFKVTEANTLLA